ncbi:hypothetical protein GCM10009799_23690 [Nocardiopsis rhodophaea]|uniref:DUF1772 domain-containing protein n=1 Tax=Nocardiopsis rhodophaea TaxID=280238 RepID=A0ABN2T103_9ACTN
MDFETLRGIALMAAALTTGLVAGLFYAFSTSVMPGLGRAEDRTFVDAMQRINVAILNGWFALAFGGAPVLMIAAAAVQLGAGGRTAVLSWIVAALVLYAAMLVITFAINIPLNNQLDAAGAPKQIDDATSVRRQFEATWVRWNIVRAVVSTGSFACLVWSLMLF